MVSIVVLAAGGASRMGAPKQLLLLGGKPLIWWPVFYACQSQAQEVIVVTGAYSNEVEAAISGLPAATVYNAAWERGQSTSVKTGVRAVSGQTKAIMFLPADQPLVTGAVLDILIDTFNKNQSSIIAPVYNKQRGAPVLFDVKWRQALLALSGDSGARNLLVQYPDEVEYVIMDNGKYLLDADTPEEYRYLQEIWETEGNGNG